MSSWTVTIFGACTRHAYKPLFENLPAWRLRGGKFRVFSAFFGENHWNRAPIAVKLRRERKPPRRRRFTQFRRRPRRRTFRSQEASPGAARWAPVPWSWRAVRGALAGATPAPVLDALPAARGTWGARGGPGTCVLAGRDPGSAGHVAGAWRAADPPGPGRRRHGSSPERPVKCGRTPTWWWGSSTVNGVPAVTYSPTPSRVQYHRRCGS